MAGRKKKQTEIPGTERVVDEAVSDAAERLHSIRVKRIKLQADESEAEAELLTAMQERKMEKYIDEDLELVATVKHGEVKVSVTKLRKPKQTVADAAE